IKEIKKPTLIISHNKTLCAQLATEFKYFFPENAVHYFVSYFDYYQPEAYIAERDTYIEKESTINQEIEMYRLGTMASLLTREDVIVVASVSALYGIGAKEVFKENSLFFKVGNKYDFTKIKKALIAMQYKPLQSNVEPGVFDFRGEILDIYSSVEKCVYRLIFDYDTLQQIQIKDSLTFKEKSTEKSLTIWPANQFIQDMGNLEVILQKINDEMLHRVDQLKSQGKLLEAERLNKRTIYDIRMIRETGFTNGIENYSLYFDNRQVGQPPNTLFDYFPQDMLLIIDESHMTLPQLRAMPSGDASRKQSLVNHGFRLPSALEHRPLNFQELEMTLSWTLPDSIKNNNYNIEFIKDKIKGNAKTLFVSATPAEYELKNSGQLVEQIIRPTGLLDPITYVYPKSGDYDILLNSLDKLIKKNPEITEFLDGFETNIKEKIIFDNIENETL
ncbi:MAG: excinuclease ABC subunit B, partial [Candidatus Absconditabacteria bacterium]